MFELIPPNWKYISGGSIADYLVENEGKSCVLVKFDDLSSSSEIRKNGGHAYNMNPSSKGNRKILADEIKKGLHPSKFMVPVDTLKCLYASLLQKPKKGLLLPRCMQVEVIEHLTDTMPISRTTEVGFWENKLFLVQEFKWKEPQDYYSDKSAIRHLFFCLDDLPEPARQIIEYYPIKIAEQKEVVIKEPFFHKVR